MKYIKLFESTENKLKKLSDGLLDFFKEFDFLKDQVTINRNDDDDYNIYLMFSESYYSYLTLIFLKVYGNSFWYKNHDIRIACMVDDFNYFDAHFNNDPMIKNTLDNIREFLNDLQ